jgi:hypothetical protein
MDGEIAVKLEPISDDDETLFGGTVENKPDHPVKGEPGVNGELDWDELESYFDGTLSNSPTPPKSTAKRRSKKEPKVKLESASTHAETSRLSASHLGRLELRKMTRAIHKRKQVDVKNYRIDETQEKSKQAFLKQLKTLLVNENAKIVNAQEALLPFQESVFSEKIQEQISQNIDCNLPNKELKRVIAQQQELDKRQRLLAKQYDLLQEYLDKQTKQSEKSLNASLQAQRKLTTVINDILAMVNQNIMDKQSQENMYISAQNTRQDIFQSNTHSSLASNPPLFRNYRTGQSGNSSEHDLKTTAKRQSKKREYIAKNENTQPRKKTKTPNKHLL